MCELNNPDYKNEVASSYLNEVGNSGQMYPNEIDPHFGINIPDCGDKMPVINVPDCGDKMPMINDPNVLHISATPLVGTLSGLGYSSSGIDYSSLVQEPSNYTFKNGITVRHNDNVSIYETYDNTILIKYHDPELVRIEKIPKGDWIDLRAAERVELKAGDYMPISLGVSMKLPRGYEAHVLPRSSTFKNYGILLVNGMGIIDNSYSGNNDIWRFPAYATRDCLIEKNDRICQFTIVKSTTNNLVINEVEDLGDNNRGGLGSTGVK